MFTSKSKESDQRQHLRFELFEYALAHGLKSRPSKQVVIVNLGLGGLQLRSREPFSVGQMLSLEIPTLSMKIPVEVRFCDSLVDSELFSVGMRFRPSRHEERIAIAKYVHAVFQSQRESLTT